MAEPNAAVTTLLPNVAVTAITRRLGFGSEFKGQRSGRYPAVDTDQSSFAGT